MDSRPQTGHIESPEGCRSEKDPEGALTQHSSPPESGPPLISRACLDLPTDASSYLSLYNDPNFPAGVAPVTTVTLQDEEELAFYKGHYGDSSDKCLWEVSFPLHASPPGAQARTESCLHPHQGEWGWGGASHS